jgi:hypothetical protein
VTRCEPEAVLDWTKSLLPQLDGARLLASSWSATSLPSVEGQFLLEPPPEDATIEVGTVNGVSTPSSAIACI